MDYRWIQPVYIIAILIVEDDGEVSHMIKVNYEWEPPTDGFQQPSNRASRGLNLSSKVQFKLMKQVYQPVPKKKGASSSGIKKKVETMRQETSTSNLFDTLKTVENDDDDDDLGSNVGILNLGKKVVNNVAGSTNGTNTFGDDLKSTFASNVTNKVGADLPSTNIPSTSKKLHDLVNADSDSEVDEVYDETASFMAQTGSKINNVAKNGSGVVNKSLYERWKETYDENTYDDDDFDYCDLTETLLAFANAFDISLRAKMGSRSKGPTLLSLIVVLPVALTTLSFPQLTTATHPYESPPPAHKHKSPPPPSPPKKPIHEKCLTLPHHKRIDKSPPPPPKDNYEYVPPPPSRKDHYKYKSPPPPKDHYEYVHPPPSPTDHYKYKSPPPPKDHYKYKSPPPPPPRKDHYKFKSPHPPPKDHYTYKSPPSLKDHYNYKPPPPPPKDHYTYKSPPSPKDHYNYKSPPPPPKDHYTYKSPPP
ncbi:hypothetical protein Tco_1121631, partial [Tanacetum coccineum]